MDIVKTKKPAFYKRKYVGLLAAISVFVGVILAGASFKLDGYSVESSNVVTAVVRRGDLSIKVSAPGVLAPEDDRWISSSVVGKVDRILAKPGAVVESGQLIVELKNHELEQQVRDLSWELGAMEAETRAMNERQKTGRLDMEAQVLDNQMNYEKEKMRLDSEEKLIATGNFTISKIDFEERRLVVFQLEKTLEMDKARSLQLDRTLEAEFEAQSARLNRLKNHLERAKFQLASLEVRAPVSGVLQALPLDLGEQVSIGDNIANIARKGDLIAELKVPEFNAYNVSVGQRVLVDTRSSKIVGEVSRVDPAVIDGTVQVDIKLMGELPDDARPDLSVDGEIFVAEKKDTLYVRRPTYSQEKQTMSVFLIDKTESYAQQTEVQFGISSSMEIEVLSGITEGDTIIVSEVDEFERYRKVALK